MLYIGVDLGTSGVKLLLSDGKGDIKRTLTKEYPIYFPHQGWAEQKPEDWLSQSICGVRELIEGFDPSAIAGICFSGQMHGLVMLDKDDNVIRPAILWIDGRSVEEVAYLNNGLGEQWLAERCSNIAFAGFTAPKLLWVKKHEPDNFKKIAKLMLPKDYLAYMFSGVHSTDVSDASGTLLFDVRSRQWSDDMLSVCKINSSMMAKIHESHEVTGLLTPRMASATGLSKNTKVIAGAGDNAAAAVGLGAVNDGSCNISLGTSGTIFIPSHKHLVDPAHALHTFAHVDGGYHFLACMLSAASCNKWWITDILGSSDYSAEQAGIGELGKNSIYFLPYLMGERSPYNDPLARAAFIGMRMDTKRCDITQAVLEGVVFGLRDSLEVVRGLGLKIDASSICGGGAKSRLWCTIAANILNIELHIPQNDEGPALGSAILAAVGCGEFSSVKDASERFVRISETIQPDAELAARYDERYREFHRLYPALKDAFTGGSHESANSKFR